MVSKITLELDDQTAAGFASVIAKAKETGQAIDPMDAEVQKFEKALDEARKSADRLGDEVKKTAQETKSAGQGMAAGFTAVGASIAGAMALVLSWKESIAKVRQAVKELADEGDTDMARLNSRIEAAENAWKRLLGTVANSDFGQDTIAGTTALIEDLRAAIDKQTQAHFTNAQGLRQYKAAFDDVLVRWTEGPNQAHALAKALQFLSEKVGLSSTKTDELNEAIDRQREKIAKLREEQAKQAKTEQNREQAKQRLIQLENVEFAEAERNRLATITSMEEINKRIEEQRQAYLDAATAHGTQSVAAVEAEINLAAAVERRRNIEKEAAQAAAQAAAERQKQMQAAADEARKALEQEKADREKAAQEAAELEARTRAQFRQQELDREQAALQEVFDLTEEVLQDELEAVRDAQAETEEERRDNARRIKDIYAELHAARVRQLEDEANAELRVTDDALERAEIFHRKEMALAQERFNFERQMREQERAANEKAREEELASQRKQIDDIKAALAELTGPDGQPQLQLATDEDTIFQEIIRQRQEEASAGIGDKRQARAAREQAKRGAFADRKAGAISQEEIASAQQSIANQQIDAFASQGKANDATIRALREQANTMAELSQSQEEMQDVLEQITEFAERQGQDVRRRRQRGRGLR